MNFFSFELCYLWWPFSKEVFFLNSSSNRVKLFQWWCWCIIEHYFCQYQYHSSDPLGLPKWIILACIKGVFELFYNKSILFIWYLMQLQQDFFRIGSNLLRQKFCETITIWTSAHLPIWVLISSIKHWQIISKIS